MRTAMATVAVFLLAACSNLASSAPTSSPVPSLAAVASPTPDPGPTPTPVDCPADASFASVAGVLPSIRLACFAGQHLTFEGVFGCGGCGAEGSWIFEPAWLAGDELEFLNAGIGAEARRLPLHFPPPLKAPAEGAILRVIGHYDDPRAADCRIWEGDVPEGATPMPLPADEVLQYCRERFVVESFEILGMGPAPSG